MRTSRILTAALAAAAIALAGATQAFADSIVYIKDRNVWIANPDGSGQYQVTTDGTESFPYRHPSQADDGTIVSGHGSEIVKLRQNGEELSRFNPPQGVDSTGDPIDLPPQDVAVSPNGERVAFVYYRYGCPVGADCGARQSLLYSWTDRETPKEEFGQQYNLRNPSWVSNERLLMFGGFQRSVNFDSPGGEDHDAVHWFDDDETEDIDDGELSRDGTRFAAIRSYGTKTHLAIWSVKGDAVNSVPDAPERACQTGTEETLEGPSWSPDGKQLAFAHKDGIEVLSLPNVQAGDCPGAGSGAIVIPGGSEPDWGPADVNPGERVVKWEANYDETRLGAALKKGVTIHVNAAGAGRAKVVLTRRGKKVAGGSGAVTAGQDSAFQARFTKKARRALRRKKSVTLDIKVVFTPADGRQQEATGRFTLKR